MTYISSSSSKNMSELPVVLGDGFLPKLIQRAKEINEQNKRVAEEVNTSKKQHPPLVIASFDLDGTLIKEVNDFDDKKSSLENYKDIYPNNDFIKHIYHSITHLTNMGIPILPLMVTSSILSRAVPIVKFSPLKTIFSSPEQIYARGIFTLGDNDKKWGQCLKRHEAAKEGSKLKTLMIEEANSLSKTLGNFFSDMIYYPLSYISKDADITEKLKTTHIKYDDLKKTPKYKEYFKILTSELDDIKKGNSEYPQKFLASLQKDGLLAQKDNITVLHFGDSKSDQDFANKLNTIIGKKTSPIIGEAHNINVNLETMSEHHIAQQIDNALKTVYEEEYKIPQE